MRFDFFTRRAAARMLLGAGSAAMLGGIARASTPADPTPSGAEGPFYPEAADRPADEDADLVRVEGRVREAGGEVMLLSGRAIDHATGAPLIGAVIEIWQCDANGRYLHHADHGPARRDAGFQGYGRSVTGADGGYAFRTIVPVPYPGRTPHIHFKIAAADGRRLTGQIYLDGHPLNAGDALFRRLSAADRAASSITPLAAGEGKAARFDFVLA